MLLKIIIAFLDTDGCPDDPIMSDSDQDGISNAIDLCPDVSETYNNFQDD